MKQFFLFLLVVGLFSCAPPEKNVLADIVNQSSEPIFDKVLSDPIKYDCQIIFEQIDRDSLNQPIFTRYTMYLNDQDYFYPASTIKMPMAFLALEKANKLGINPDFRMAYDSVRYPQSSFVYDSTAYEVRPTLNQFMKTVFLYSDNNANNRMYEFLGQDYIHDQLAAKGLPKTQLVHRLSDARFGPEENKYTNPVNVFDDQDSLVYAQAEQVATQTHEKRIKNLIRGRGHIDKNDSLVYLPFDFSEKNYFPLTEQLGVLKRVLFPDFYNEGKRFDLREEDYTNIYRAMGMRPRESMYPKLDSTEYYDSYVKLLMFGDRKEPMPENIRIFNKVGWAYGFLTDVAYVVDFENNVEFLLAATVHVNENSIYNDGEYEYDDIGVPYLGALGSAVYDHELKREKDREADLSRFLVGWNTDLTDQTD